MKKYDADSITVLEGLEAVRKRPGMYIGGVGTKGLNHLIYEIVDNSVDEHLAGFCKNIWVTLEKDGSCTIRDDGRGIPTEMHKKGVAAERIVLSTLHAGGKFDNEAYKTSGGLHGVGSSVVNALSKRLDIKIYRNGLIYQDSYKKGIPDTELIDGLLPVIGKTKLTGTLINFTPDDEIFEQTRFKEEWLKSRLHETAYLNPELTLHYENKREGEEEQLVFHEPDGIIAYVKELNKQKTTIHSPIYVKGKSEGIEVEIALQFVDTFEVFRKKFHQYNKLKKKPLMLFWFRCGMHHPDGIIPWNDWKMHWLDSGYIPKRVGHNMKMIHKNCLTTDLEFYDFEDDRVVLWKGENYERRKSKNESNQKESELYGI